MSTEDIKELEKAVQKARFVLSQKASVLHDLIEDRLPSDYQEIPHCSSELFAACEEWDKLNQRFIAAKKA